MGQNIFKAYANDINRVTYLSYIKENILCRVKINVSSGNGQFLIIHDELIINSFIRIKAIPFEKNISFYKLMKHVLFLLFRYIQ